MNNQVFKYNQDYKYNFLKFGKLAVSDETVNNDTKVDPNSKIRLLSLALLTKIFRELEKLTGRNKVDANIMFGFDAEGNGKIGTLLGAISNLLDTANDEYDGALFKTVFGNRVKVDGQYFYLNFDNQLFTKRIGKKILAELKKTGYSLPISDKTLDFITNAITEEYKNFINKEIVPAYKTITNRTQFRKTQFLAMSTNQEDIIEP